MGRSKDLRSFPACRKRASKAASSLLRSTPNACCVRCRRISCVTRACTVRSSFLRRSIRATSSAARSAKPDLLAFQPFVVRRRAALRVRTRFGQGRASFRTAVRSGRRSAARMLSLWETWAGTKRNAVRRDLPSHRIFTFGRYALRRGAVCVWPRRLCPPRSRNPTVRSCS